MNEVVEVVFSWGCKQGSGDDSHRLGEPIKVDNRADRPEGVAWHVVPLDPAIVVCREGGVLGGVDGDVAVGTGEVPEW